MRVDTDWMSVAGGLKYHTHRSSQRFRAIGKVRHAHANRSVIGPGTVAMPLDAQFINTGYAVNGYRRSSMADFEAAGGKPLSSPAEGAENSDFLVSCLPSVEALADVRSTY